MRKRGQITIFMIVGFVILLVIILIFGLRKAGVGISSSDFLYSKMDVVEKQVKDCTKEKLIESLEIIGKQGGTLDPVNYRMHGGNSVSYLCYNIPNKPECLNKMVFNNDIENEVEEYLNFYVPQCLDLEGLKKSFFFPEVRSARYTSDVEIREEGVFVKINYPITLVKDETQLTLNDFTELDNVPIGKLLDVTYDIINSESRDGMFFSVPYMIANRGEVEIFVDQQEYPDKIYVLNQRNSNYIFQFGVEGEAGR